MTYGNLATVEDPWIAQLPNHFSTGTKSNQFIPRVDSSVSIQNMTAMPPACQEVNAAVSVNFSGNLTTGLDPFYKKLPTTDSFWSIKACLPQHPQSSPFSNTRNKQTVTDTLHLDLSTSMWLADEQYVQRIYEITVDATRLFLTRRTMATRTHLVRC